MMRVWTVILLLLSTTQIASAQDLVQDTVPTRWMQRWMPEDLPELKFPGYFNDLDKAKALVFHGRYKAALNQLKKVTQGEANQIAPIKAEALWNLGRDDEALEAAKD